MERCNSSSSGSRLSAKTRASSETSQACLMRSLSSSTLSFSAVTPLRSLSTLSFSLSTLSLVSLTSFSSFSTLAFSFSTFSFSFSTLSFSLSTLSFSPSTLFFSVSIPSFSLSTFSFSFISSAPCSSSLSSSNVFFRNRSAASYLVAAASSRNACMACLSLSNVSDTAFSAAFTAASSSRRSLPSSSAVSLLASSATSRPLTCSSDCSTSANAASASTRAFIPSALASSNSRSRSLISAIRLATEFSEADKASVKAAHSLFLPVKSICVRCSSREVSLSRSSAVISASLLLFTVTIMLSRFLRSVASLRSKVFSKTALCDLVDFNWRSRTPFSAKAAARSCRAAFNLASRSPIRFFKMSMSLAAKSLLLTPLFAST
mmetsp:Transcript_25897/g.47319  ORF Transcript_25897/g.47319 Transcript_25897/m.47319 type:complete len:376 (+) Transcript_25897:755-1882(+)